MQHFTRRIQTREGFFNFYFNRIYTVAGLRYHISLVDNEKKVISFLMEKKESTWHLVNPYNCLEWILSFEEQLSSIINEEY
jgi:hypothetical protein